MPLLCVQVASRLHPVGTEIEPSFTLLLTTAPSSVNVSTLASPLVSPTDARLCAHHLLFMLPGGPFCAEPLAGRATFVLSADLANMRHLYSELDKAQKQLQSFHARRVMRLVK